MLDEADVRKDCGSAQKHDQIIGFWGCVVSIF